MYNKIMYLFMCINNVNLVNNWLQSCQINVVKWKVQYFYLTFSGVEMVR